MLSKEFIKKYENTQPDWGFNNLGYVVYKRTYARKKDDGTTEEWWETCERVTNWVAETHEKIGVAMPRNWYEKLYDYMFTLKGTVSGRLLWQAGTSTVDKLGGASLCNCLSKDTKIITKEGLKRIEDVEGKFVDIMDGKGHWINSEIRNFGTQHLKKIVFTRNGSTKTTFATPEHRWIRRAYRSGYERDLSSNVEVTTDTLLIGDKIPTILGQSIKSIKHISPIGIMSGIVFGDGTINNNVASVRLCGDKDRQLLQHFDSFPTYEVDEDIIVHHLPKYFKDKPSHDMDKGYLYGWIAGYFAADGSVKESGEIRLASANKENLEFVKSLCSTIGIATKPIISQNRKGINGVYSDMHSMGFIGSTLDERFFLIEKHRERFNSIKYKKVGNWKVLSIEDTDINEDVYCAVVPTTHSFVLEDNMLTGNCWAVIADSKQSFLNVFDYLMLGGGVGFNMQKQYVSKLPKIKEVKHVTRQDDKDADFIVPDTREGWVSLLDKLLTSYFETGKSFTYSTHLIRPYGEDIKGFGGTASGPEPLVTMADKLRGILHSQIGKKLRPIDVLDIMNIIGECVVAGNVRRSSEIALGDVDDIEFLEAKQWSKGVPNHRAMSNNTIICDDIEELTDKYWRNYEVDSKTGLGVGEPYGLFNLAAAKKQGRTGDYQYDDPDAVATNPCGEITLAPSHGDGGAESCNLVEIFLNNIKDSAEFEDVAKTLYIVAKTVTLVDYHIPETDAIVKKNSRIGIGITGIYQRADLILPSVLDHVYTELRKYDEVVSDMWGCNPSIKLTTVKPSGTLSLLAGATPGAHPDHAPYYIRRVRMNPDDKLVEMCKTAGYHVEYAINNDGTPNTQLVIVSFPIKSNKVTTKKEDVDACSHLDMVKHLQEYWSDNQVSVTVDYTPEELGDIKKWLKSNYNENIKSLSFLLRQNSGFKQQPLEEISKKKYDEMMSNITAIDFEQTVEEDILAESVECEGGHCPIR